MAHFVSVAISPKKPKQVSINGIYNIGTGQARSFKDLAINVMQSMSLEPNIMYVDMPADLQGKYQYFTEATMAKLKAVGYNTPFTSLEAGVKDYVQNYLLQDDRYC